MRVARFWANVQWLEKKSSSRKQEIKKTNANPELLDECENIKKQLQIKSEGMI